MKKCHFCKEEIIKDASVCKHCGKKQPTSLWIIMIIIIAGLVIIWFSMDSDEFQMNTSQVNKQKQDTNTAEYRCRFLSGDQHKICENEFIKEQKEIQEKSEKAKAQVREIMDKEYKEKYGQ